MSESYYPCDAGAILARVPDPLVGPLPKKTSSFSGAPQTEIRKKQPEILDHGRRISVYYFETPSDDPVERAAGIKTH